MYRTFPIADARLAFMRHWETYKTANFAPRLATAVDADTLFCMRHSRLLADDSQGLAFEGWQHAEADGRRLFERGVKLARLEHSAGYSRNREGAIAKLHGYTHAGGGKVSIIGNPLGNCPVYDFDQLLPAVREHGDDFVVHRWLSGGLGLDAIASETPTGFFRRLCEFVRNGVEMGHLLGGTVVFDGNFEQCLALWAQFVAGVDRSSWADQPKEDLWQPRHGYAVGFRGDLDDPEVCEYDEDFNPIERS